MSRSATAGLAVRRLALQPLLHDPRTRRGRGSNPSPRGGRRCRDFGLRRETILFSRRCFKQRGARYRQGGRCMIDAVDKKLIDRLQAGLPITEAPFAAIADPSSVSTRPTSSSACSNLLDKRVLLPFRPDVRRRPPRRRADAWRRWRSRKTASPESPSWSTPMPEVAHNYRRDHRLNMWFVLATERPERIEAVLKAIEPRPASRAQSSEGQRNIFWT